MLAVTNCSGTISLMKRAEADPTTTQVDEKDYYLGRVLMRTKDAVSDLVIALPDEEIFAHQGDFVIPHIRRHSRTRASRAMLGEQLKKMREMHPPVTRPRHLTTLGTIDYGRPDSQVLAIKLASSGRFSAGFLEYEALVAQSATGGQEYLARRSGFYIVRIAEVSTAAQLEIAQQVLHDHHLVGTDLMATPTMVCEAPVATG